MEQNELLRCPKCGIGINIGQKFCTSCGTEISKVFCPACGEKIKFGQNFCTSCGANINDAISTANTQIISPRFEIPESDREFLKEPIVGKDTWETRQFLHKYLRQVSNYDETSRNKIYEMIGIFIKEDLRIYSTFCGIAKELLSPQLFIEMEVFLLKKYFLLDGEELITSSNGNITFDDKSRTSGGMLLVMYDIDKAYHELRGRIYITNQRIIALGKHRMKESMQIAGFISQGYGGIEFPYKAGIRFWVAGIDEVVPYYFNAGEFPLSKAFIYIDNTKRKKNRVAYTLKFDYVYNEKPGNRTEKLKFEPVNESGEKKIDFQKRRDVFLSKINEFMNSTISSTLKEGKK